MLTERRWELPDPNNEDRLLHFYEELDQPQGWGKSQFWYCYSCGKTYAKAVITQGARLAPFKAHGGCCPTCKGQRWTLPGSLECAELVGWRVPYYVLQYQLSCEFKFLSHPHHPHNSESLYA